MTKKKKTCYEKLPLPKWKNNEAGKAFWLYFVGILLQICALFLPYWTIVELVEPDVEHKLWVFGYEEGFYQEMGLCVFIKFCIFWALAISLVCTLASFKAAKIPGRKDKKVQTLFASLGFFGWLFGILSMAMFSPGEKGDRATTGPGFFCQMFGLTLMLGGIIVQFEAGNPNNLSAAVRNRLFGPNETSVTPASPKQPDPPKASPPKEAVSVVPGGNVPPPPTESDKLLDKVA